MVKTKVILHTINFNDELQKKKKSRNSKLIGKEVIIIYICIHTDFGWDRVNFFTLAHGDMLWICNLNSADKALMFLINA